MIIDNENERYYNNTQNRRRKDMCEEPERKQNAHYELLDISFLYLQLEQVIHAS